MATHSPGLLDEKPKLDELTRHVDVGVAWHRLGIQLKLDPKHLDAIDQSKHYVADKLSAMFQLWLERNSSAAKRDVLDALRNIGHNAIAQGYKEALELTDRQQQQPDGHSTVAQASTIGESTADHAHFINALETMVQEDRDLAIIVHELKTKFSILEIDVKNCLKTESQLFKDAKLIVHIALQSHCGYGPDVLETDRLNNVSNVEELFDYLWDHNFLSYLNYGLLEKISELLPNIMMMRQKFEDYKKEYIKLLKCASFEEIIRSFPGLKPAAIIGFPLLKFHIDRPELYDSLYDFLEHLKLPPSYSADFQDGMSTSSIPVTLPKELKEDQKYFEDAMKDGSVKSYVTKAVIQGEARAGKTSLKCLLLRKTYNKLSTNIEAPQVAFGSFSVNRFGHTTGKCWTLVDDDEMDDKVLAELKLITVDSRKKEEELPAHTQSDDSSYNVHMLASDKHTTSKTTSASESSTSYLEASKTDEPISLSPESSSDTAITNQIIVKVKEMYEQCKKVQKEEGLSFHQEWLYFIDSGGQIQFQKLLPAFMPFASVLILVLNVAKNLSDPASTEMQLQEQQISVDEHSPTVEEILKQILSAVASSTEQFNTLIISDDCILSKYIKPPAGKLNVISVATHCDEIVKKETRDMKQHSKKDVEFSEVKEVKLQEMADLLASKCLIVRTCQSNILHEVDGRKAAKSEFDDPVVEQIAEKLKDQAYKIDIPIRWYCFNVLLRKIAKEDCGVLSLSFCETLGKHLKMSKDEVMSALKFFHILNMLLYYPDSPVADMVFVPLNSLVDIIGQLVVLVCTARNNWRAEEDDVKELATKGFLSVKVLEKSQQYCKVSQFFPDFGSKLLDLFEHLLIAVRLPADKNMFLMPALLPVRDTVPNSSSCTPDPLLFSFKSAVPMGLFCAFIVHLLSLKRDLCDSSSTSDYESSLEDDEEISSLNNQWNIVRTKDLNWSNYFRLQYNNIEDAGTFVFIERLDCIEVHAEYQPNYRIGKIVEGAIKSTIQQRGLKEKVKKAFYCNCLDGEGMRHLAVVCRVEHKFVLRCNVSQKWNYNLDDEKRRWLREKESRTSEVLEILSLNDRPTRAELTEHVPISNKWNQLGIQLKLEGWVLSAIDVDFNNSMEKLSHMYQCWLDRNPNAARKDVLEALRKIGEMTIASKYEKWMHEQKKAVRENTPPVSRKKLTSKASEMKDSSVSSLLTDMDLKTCSRFIRGNLEELSGYLNIPHEFYQTVVNKYGSVSVQAYQLLKEWMSAAVREGGTADRQELIDTLELLEYTEAAKSIQQHQLPITTTASDKKIC